MSYESDQLHDWYILFHYGEIADILHKSAFSAEQLPTGCFDFPTATVDALRQTETAARALDLGCAVGRSTFELTKYAKEVIGIDFSERFIEAAAEIKNGKPYPYYLYLEGHLREPRSANLPTDIDPDAAHFETGDAMNLRSDLGSFDLVHAANLLCRLPEPKRFLDRLPDLVNPAGKLVIATPATWLPEYTPQGNLPQTPTLEYLSDHLNEAFEFVEKQEIPFFIREHQRKFQLSTSQTSLWIRRT